MTSEISIQYFKTVYGELIIGDFQNQICLCDWRFRAKREMIDTRITSDLKSNFVVKNTDLIEETKNQLNEYFAKKRFEFSVPILPLGTEFQQTVWQELMKIPYGKTTNYLEISEKINSPKAFRAVANANGANAISIIIPCHRVIGKNEKLVGYAGGIVAKEKLLKLESEQLFSAKNDIF